MLSDDEFNQWCCCLKLSEKAQQEIQHVRSSAPSRRVRGAHNNVTGRYPSRKMGLSIQFESHKVELPFIYQLEHDEDVLEYYDQPPSFKLSYQEASGRNLGFYITPDFFVIHTNSVGWVECKPEDKLNQLAQKSSRRYVLGDDNQWHSPPAEQYAQQFGFFFRLWSNAEINWTLHGNLEFLADYYKSDAFEVTKATRNTILSMISAQPGITLANLLHHGEGVSTDDIYHLIANEEIYVNLTASPLVEAEKCLLFIDQLYEETYNAIILSQSTTNTIHSLGVELIPGITVLYSGKSLTITLVGETEVLLQTSEQQIVTLSLSTFDELVKQGKITKSTTQKTDEINNQVMDLFKKASFPDLMAANRRYRLIQPYLDGQPIKTNTPQERSLRIWLRAYRQAQQKYGYGYLGILHFENKKGNRNRKLPQHILNLIDKFIIERYETKKQKRKQSVYNEFVHFCVETGISELQVPSYKTFIKEIKKRSGYEQTLKREGLRSAYRLEPFYWELEVTTPRHGDFPFHICHIDHTESDIELRCSKTGKVLGRAWITLLVDAFSRRILAVYASYDPPSYRSCMMVLRICVKRYGRLPQTIVTDNAKEFYSTYFETLLALFECTLKHRPSSKSRFSSVCERLFGTTNTQFFYNLAGNTQITKKVRLMTKSVSPKNLSLWTLGWLYLYLCEWAYSIYDTIEHPGLEGQSPREVFSAGIAQYGSRDHRRISYDENFRILTLPTTNKSRAKVQPGKGIKVEQKYYWSNTFRDPEIENTSVDVRYDPFNAGIAYAYVRGQWVECISEYYSLFRGRSEKEIQIATTQLKKQKQNHASSYRIRAKQLGEFLASLEVEEILLEQRLRDKQAQEVFQVIEGELPLLSPYNQTPNVDEEKEQDKLNSSTESQLEVNELVNPQKVKIFKIY
ncbi:MAG: DDE-type integrase/transposase/recombinase [Nostoc sp.]|uniref:TnsA endonuclease C-terminal domain-containing protein n=1 Tax=Nostoc sp. TaxID=1180 RepID=UPI002FF72B33